MALGGEGRGGGGTAPSPRSLGARRHRLVREGGRRSRWAGTVRTLLVLLLVVTTSMLLFLPLPRCPHLCPPFRAGRLLADPCLDCRQDVLQWVVACLSPRELRFSFLPLLHHHDQADRAVYEAMVRDRLRESKKRLGEVSERGRERWPIVSSSASQSASRSKRGARGVTIPPSIHKDIAHHHHHHH